MDLFKLIFFLLSKVWVSFFSTVNCYPLIVVIDRNNVFVIGYRWISNRDTSALQLRYYGWVTPIMCCGAPYKRP